MHIHGVRFRMLERNGAVPADLRDGVVDTGFRDVVGVFAGEQVRVEVAPTVAGQFLYHCHNLEHEDGGMMRNVVFGSGGGALGEHA
jgi:bilirubin oxidase